MPTAPTALTVPGASLSPTSPTVVTPSTGVSNKFGAPQKSFIVAGFTSDAASVNSTFEAATSPTALQQYVQPGTSGDNYLGYDTDRWNIYAENGVTTGEFKAEMVTADSKNPTGTYTGINTQTGDTVTVSGVPPTPLTVT